jgi:hypothetical protein
MLIEWKGLGPLCIGDPRKSNYKMAAVIVCTPGVNKIEDEVWERVSKNPEMIKLLESDRVVVVRASDPDQKAAEKKGEAVELFGLSLNDAMRVVGQTLNFELLEQWAESETRPKVKRAIEKQLDKLTIKKSDKSEE